MLLRRNRMWDRLPIAWAWLLARGGFLTRPVFFIAAASALTSARAESLDAVLAHMDAAARQFQSFSAHIRQTDYTAAIDDSDVSTGEVRMKRGKSGVSMVIEYGEPNPRSIGISGHTVQIYSPKANVVDIYDTSKYTARVDQYLLLGFGTTSAELRKNYDVKLGGVDPQGTRLELIPRSAEALKLVSKIELWIPEGQGSPVQEKITKASKDTLLVEYSDMKLNPPLPDSAFELKLPAGVRKHTPQK